MGAGDAVAVPGTAQALFAPLPHTYDRMAAVLSFGQEERWRRALISCVPASAGSVLDVASGTGAVAIALLRQRPGARVVSLDQSEPMLRQAVLRTNDAGLGDHTTFTIAQAERLPFDTATFDALTFTYLMRYVEDPADTMRELVRVVRPGGIVASLEFHVPANPIWRAAWLVYTRIVMPIEGALVSRGWYRVGRFLGASISGFYRAWPLERQLSIWEGAGLDGVRYRTMSLGGAVVLCGEKPHG